MNIDYTSIALTYSREASLATAGVYSDAKMSKHHTEDYNDGFGNKFQIPSVAIRSKTISEPVYHNCKQKITLGKAFIDNALERPKKPHNKASIDEWNAYHNWFKMSIENRLSYGVVKYVSDLGGTKPEFELM